MLARYGAIVALRDAERLRSSTYFALQAAINRSRNYYFGFTSCPQSILNAINAVTLVLRSCSSARPIVACLSLRGAHNAVLIGSVHRGDVLARRYGPNLRSIGLSMPLLILRKTDVLPGA